MAYFSAGKLYIIFEERMFAKATTTSREETELRQIDNVIFTIVITA